MYQRRYRKLCRGKEYRKKIYAERAAGAKDLRRKSRRSKRFTQKEPPE
ncbi:MAG: hypothetical protein HFH50_12235 [Lachnospiraceae bacterium]|nr:hypothetical protein [Lachnospiraceae bacterium]